MPSSCPGVSRPSDMTSPVQPKLIVEADRVGMPAIR
jgi:hypothetical protein